MSQRQIYLFIAGILTLSCIIIVWQFPTTPFVRGYLGDVLVVALLFSVAKVIHPRIHPLWLACGVFAFAVAVETLQWVYAAVATQRTGIEQIVLGTHFDWWDIVAYGTGTTLIYAAARIINNDAA